MEKDLTKFVTLEQASKKNYITLEMIERLCSNNQIPYFNNYEEMLVNPEDVKEFFRQYFFGTKFEVKRRKKIESVKPPAEEPLDNIVTE